MLGPQGDILHGPDYSGLTLQDLSAERGAGQQAGMPLSVAHFHTDFMGVGRLAGDVGLCILPTQRQSSSHHVDASYLQISWGSSSRVKVGGIAR